MADLRLLRALLSIGLVVASAGCGLGPIWACRVEGQVVDAQTGAPVAGADVSDYYSTQHNYRGYDWHWATTDAEGRFAIPGHFAMLWGPQTFLSESWHRPDFQVLHPSYGLFTYLYSGRGHPLDWPGFRNLRFEVTQNDAEVNGVFKDPHRWSSLCGRVPHRVCVRRCEVVYGSADRCPLAGIPGDDE